MVVAPDPAAMTVVDRSQLALDPVPFIGVLDAIDPSARRIDQFDGFARIAQPTCPASEHSFDSRINVSKDIRIGSHDEIRLSIENHVRKDELDPLAETPSRQGDRLGTSVEQFDPLLANIFRPLRMRRMVHDLGNDHAGPRAAP